MYLDGNKTTTPWLEVDIGFKKKKRKNFLGSNSATGSKHLKAIYLFESKILPLGIYLQQTWETQSKATLLLYKGACCQVPYHDPQIGSQVNVRSTRCD